MPRTLKNQKLCVTTVHSLAGTVGPLLPTYEN